MVFLKKTMFREYIFELDWNVLDFDPVWHINCTIYALNGRTNLEKDL